MARGDLQIQAVAEAMKLLGEQNRLRLILALRGRQMNVSSLCSLLGATQPAISRNLALLRMQGFVVSRRSGKQIFYRLSNAATPYGRWLTAMLKAKGSEKRRGGR